MSSQDTLRVAQSELAKAEEFEKQAQKVLDTAQQQANKFQQDAQVHRSEYSRLMTQSQDEQRQELEDLNRAA